MSQRVIGYEGEGRHRRAIRTDEGPASATVDTGSVMAQVTARGLLSVSAFRGVGERLTGGAGPIERRQITDAERAVRAETRPGTAHVHRQPGWNGPLAVRPSVTQEDPVSEPRPDIPETIPGAAAPLDDALSGLAEATIVAIEARDAKTIADAAWKIAQRSLADAWKALPPLDIPDDAPRATSDETEASQRWTRPEYIVPPDSPVAAALRVVPYIATADEMQTSRRNGQAAMREVVTKRPESLQHPKAAGDTAERAERVMSALERHGGDVAAVMAELGMRRNAISMVVKHARRRAGVQA